MCMYLSMSNFFFWPFFTASQLAQCVLHIWQIHHSCNGKALPWQGIRAQVCRFNCLHWVQRLVTSFSLRASHLFFSVGNSRAIRAWWWWRRRTCQILPHFHQLSVLFLPHLLFFPSSPSAPTIHPHCKYPMNKSADGDLPRGWVCFLGFPDPDGELVESVKLVWVVDALDGGLFQKSHTIKAWQNISLPYCSVLNIISQQLITRSRENAQKGDANCGSRLPHPCMWLLILVTTLNRDHALHAFKFDSK